MSRAKFYPNGPDVTKHPTVTRLLKAGIIYAQDGEYLGMAKDGTIVAVGTVGFEDAAESYLFSHSTSDTW